MRQTLMCAVVALAFFVPGSALAGIEYSDFSSVDGLTIVGDAYQHGDRLRLTSADGGVGGAWFSVPQHVQSGFVTTFQFQITVPPYSSGADGLAFVVQNHSPTALGVSGGGIGFHTIPNSLAVELDTWHNWEFGEPNGNHVSVQTQGTDPNSIVPSASLGWNTDISNLSDGQVHSIKVEYEPGGLTVYMDDLASPVLFVPVNLASLLELDQGEAFVGFTAATGGATEDHDILNWSFSGGYPFAEFQVVRANLGFTDSGPGHDSWSLAARIALAGESDGVEPLWEDVTVGFGSMEIMIPAGSFVAAGSTYRWEGFIDGSKAWALFQDLGAGSYAFRIEVDAVDLAGTGNIVPCRLTIGNDRGEATKRLQGVLYLEPDSCDRCVDWKNHGEYVSCVARAVREMVSTGILTDSEANQYVSAAARSSIGKKGYIPAECQ